MATSNRTGRFGEDKPVQRNKETTGPKQNRSPAQSNANRLAPSLREDVGASQKADFKRIGKAIMPADKKLVGASARSIPEAGGRAMLRTASRAALGAGALMQGYDIGRAIDEKTGVGRKMVDTVADAMPSREGVKLSKEAERRLADERIKRVGSVELASDKEDKVEAKKPAAVAKKAVAAKRSSVAEKDMPRSSVREGRNTNIDEETRKRAMELAKGGAVMKKKPVAAKKAMPFAKGGAVKKKGC